MVFDKFPHRASIYSANLLENQKLRNSEFRAVHSSHYLFGKCSKKYIKGIRELFFLIIGHQKLLKDFLDPEQGALQVVMFKVRDKMHPAFKMHFRCELRCVCAVGYLPRQDCIYRDMEYLKFGLMFDLNFFHKLDLYQDNKSLLNLRFQCFLIPRIYYLCQF